MRQAKSTTDATSGGAANVTSYGNRKAGNEVTDDKMVGESHSANGENLNQNVNKVESKPFVNGPVKFISPDINVDKKEEAKEEDLPVQENETKNKVYGAPGDKSPEAIQYATTPISATGKTYSIVTVDGNGDSYNELKIIVWKDVKKYGQNGLFVQLYHLETKEYSEQKFFPYDIKFDHPGLEFITSAYLTKANEYGAHFINFLKVINSQKPQSKDRYNLIVFASGAYRKDGKYYVKLENKLHFFQFDKNKMTNHNDELQGQKLERNIKRPQIELTVGKFHDKIILQYEPNYDEALFKSDGGEYVSSDPSLKNKAQISAYMFGEKGSEYSSSPVPIFNLNEIGSEKFDLISKTDLTAKIDIGNEKSGTVNVNYVILPGEDPNPALNRKIRLIFTGKPVLGGQQNRIFNIKNGHLSAGSFFSGKADYLRISELEAEDQVMGIDVSGGITSEIANARGTQNVLRAQLAAKNVISQRTLDAWNDYTFAYLQLEILMKSNQNNQIENKSLIKAAAEKANIYFALVSNETKGEFTSEFFTFIPNAYNPYTNPEADYSGLGPNPDQAIQNQGWEQVKEDFMRLKKGYDDWTIYKASEFDGEQHEEDEIKSIGQSFENSSLLESGEDGLTSLKDRQKKGEIKYLQKIKAVFYGESSRDVDNFNKQSTKGAVMPLSLWAYVEDGVWKIVDYVKPGMPYFTTTDVRFDPKMDKDADVKQGYSPPYWAFTGEDGLANEDHLPKGKIYLYHSWSGAMRVIEWEGENEKDVWDYLGYAGLALAAIGLGILTFGAGTLVVAGSVTLGAVAETALVLSSIVSIASTAGSLYEKSSHGQLTKTDLLLGILEIFTSAIQLKMMAFGKILASSEHALFKTATMLYLPLKVTAAAGETAQIIVLTVDAAQKIQAIANSPGSSEDKSMAIAMLVGQLSVSGAFFIMDLDLKKSSPDLPPPQDLLNERTDIRTGADAAVEWIPPVQGVDPYEHSILKAQLGANRVEDIDKWLKQTSKGHKLIEKYGTEGVYHAVNITGGDIPKAQKLLNEQGQEYANKQLAKINNPLPVNNMSVIDKKLEPHMARKAVEHVKPIKRNESALKSEYSVYVVENNQRKGYTKKEFTQKVNAGEFDNKTQLRYATSDKEVLELVEVYSQSKKLEMKVEYTSNPASDPGLVDMVPEVVNELELGTTTSGGGKEPDVNQQHNTTSDLEQDVLDLTVKPFDPKQRDQNGRIFRGNDEYLSHGGNDYKWNGIEWKLISKDEYYRVVYDWTDLENKLISKLSSTMKPKKLERLIDTIKNSGEEGVRLAKRIEAGTFEKIENYAQVISNAIPDLQSLKSANQALDQAEELLTSGIDPSLLKFEHKMEKGDGDIQFDIDLGIRISPGSGNYSVVYQFKSNTSDLTKSSLSKAASQLFDAPAGKRIIGFKLTKGDEISRIQNDEGLKEEMKHLLHDKQFNSRNNVIIDEIHLTDANGERVKVIYKDENLEFIKF